MACNDLKGVHLAGKPKDSLWNISCSGSHIGHISEYKGSQNEADGRLVTPSLCHAHIHLDKCFLLSHPKYSDLQVEKGDFQEALELTSKYMLHRSFLFPSFTQSILAFVTSVSLMHSSFVL